MPVIVIHTEPTHDWHEPSRPIDNGALEYVLAFPLIVALVLALFFKRWR